MLFVCLLAFFLLVLSLYWGPLSMWSWILCRLEDKVLVSFFYMLISKFLSTLCWTVCLFFSEQFFIIVVKKTGSYSHIDICAIPSFYSIGLQVYYVPVSYWFYCYGDVIISSAKFLLFRIILTILDLHSVTAKKWISNISIHSSHLSE